MDLLTCLLVIFFVCFHTSNGQQACTNPLKRNGYCVIFDYCPPIMAIINNPSRKRNDTKFMSDSFCGNDITNGISKFKVCCDANVAIIGCLVPEPPSGGTYEIDGKLPQNDTRAPVSSVLVYKCHENFTAEPDDSIYCQNDGNWNNKVTCNQLNNISRDPKNDIITLKPSNFSDEIKCILPNISVSGDFTVNGFALDPGQKVDKFFMVLFECHNGLTLEQKNDTMYCSGDGEWSDDLECLRQCSDSEKTFEALNYFGLDIYHEGIQTTKYLKCALPKYGNKVNYSIDRMYVKPGSEVFYYTIVDYDCPACSPSNGRLYCAETGYLVDNVNCLENCKSNDPSIKYPICE